MRTPVGSGRGEQAVFLDEVGLYEAARRVVNSAPLGAAFLERGD